MNKFFNFLFNRQNYTKESLLFDEVFLEGKLTTEQLYNLSKLFSVIPEMLIIGNKQHIRNAWKIVKYYTELVQLPKKSSISSISKLKYPKSTIKSSFLYILEDIEKNEMLNFDIYELRKDEQLLVQLKSSLYFLSIQMDSSYVDMDEFIASMGSKSDKKLDESLEFLKSIVMN